MNSLKRMLETLRPQIESQVKVWGSCIPESGTIGESLSEVTVMIRSKFRAYVQAVIEKLVENVSSLLCVYCILVFLVMSILVEVIIDN